MTSQKAENLLNLALDATQEERAKSLELDVGYNSAAREWDLIVKYSGSLVPASTIATSVTELANEYAIITIAESKIEELTRLPQVEYIEKPKRLFFQVANGRRVSCIDAVQDTRFSLFGQGVLIAVLDSGIDYTLPVFRNKDGTTKIRNLWDQTAIEKEEEAPPVGYKIGVEYTSPEINAALGALSKQEQMRLVSSVDNTGHGTAVAGVATQVAPKSELLIVKLGIPKKEGFPRTTELMQGLDYVIRKALEYRMPVAVNISFGNTYGSHDGSSLLERFIDDMANRWKSCICIGTGNEAASAGHTSGTLREGMIETIPVAVQSNQPTLNIQIWKAYTDVAEVSLISPSGAQIGPIQEILGAQRFVTGQTEILLYYGEPSPFSTVQEIFIDMLPRDSYITPGVWQIILTPRSVVSGRYEMWLPSEGVLNRGTGFRYPTATGTLTIPSTAGRAISVGAYNALNFSYAGFSGRGYAGDTRLIKPDIVAPGVNVTTVAVGGGDIQVTGTSFAAPFATGSAALLMEWGIVRGNDSYLYGEKIKAYFHRGAKPLPGFTQYPNAQVGYGALCVRDSLPQ